MDQDYFHWGDTAEIMEIIRGKKARRLVDRRLVSRPGTMRRKFDLNGQRQV